MSIRTKDLRVYVHSGRIKIDIASDKVLLYVIAPHSIMLRESIPVCVSSTKSKLSSIDTHDIPAKPIYVSDSPTTHTKIFLYRVSLM